MCLLCPSRKKILTSRSILFSQWKELNCSRDKPCVSLGENVYIYRRLLLYFSVYALPLRTATVGEWCVLLSHFSLYFLDSAKFVWKSNEQNEVRNTNKKKQSQIKTNHNSVYILTFGINCLRFSNRVRIIKVLIKNTYWTEIFEETRIFSLRVFRFSAPNVVIFKVPEINFVFTENILRHKICHRRTRSATYQ